MFINFFLILFILVPFVSFASNSKVYFSPNGGCQEAVVTEISKAKKSIDIAMYSFTSREIAQELVKAKDRKVKIRIVLDKGQKTENYSKSRYLIEKDFEVKYHNGDGLMHNKFSVFDGKVLITGSFNWTAGAESKNEENLLIMTDKYLIKKYEDRFDYLWKSSDKGQ